MAGKTNLNRTRRMRTVILSASILSFLPLIGVMHAGQAGSEGTGIEAVAPASVASIASSSATTAAATTTVVTNQIQSASQMKAAASSSQAAAASQQMSSYTRTRAS